MGPQGIKGAGALPMGGREFGSDNMDPGRTSPIPAEGVWGKKQPLHEESHRGNSVTQGGRFQLEEKFNGSIWRRNRRHGGVC